jgi:nucleotide-binding universal stress UspA family protein
MTPIMLATDGSPSAEEATSEAIDLAARLELPLIVVSVAHDSTPGYGYYGYAEIAAEMRKIELDRIGTVLEAVEARAEDAGVEVETLALEGVAGRELCRVAAEHDARLVVIGAHGWGRLGRLIHGSVSTYVLHHATTPVLVVHGDDAAVLDHPLQAQATSTSK